MIANGLLILLLWLLGISPKIIADVRVFQKIHQSCNSDIFFQILILDGVAFDLLIQFMYGSYTIFKQDTFMNKLELPSTQLNTEVYLGI